MSVETVWIIALIAVAVAAVVGFFVGRSGHGTAQERIAELETEVKRRSEELGDYKKEVEAHFDKTASLFVDMAGSYKALFEHLSADYEKLSDGSAQELFKERVGALLMDSDAPKALTAEACDSTTAAEQASPEPETPQSVADVSEGGESQLTADQADTTTDAVTEADAAKVTEDVQPAGVAAQDAPAETTQTEPKPAEMPTAEVQEAPVTKQAEGDSTAVETETILEKAARKRAEDEASSQGSSKS